MTLEQLLIKSRGCDYDVYGIKKEEVKKYYNCEVLNFGVENNTLLIIIDSTEDSGLKNAIFWNKLNFREGFKEEKKQVLTYLKNRREYHHTILKENNIGSVKLSTAAIIKELDAIISHIEKVVPGGIVKEDDHHEHKGAGTDIRNY